MASPMFGGNNNTQQEASSRAPRPESSSVLDISAMHKRFERIAVPPKSPWTKSSLTDPNMKQIYTFDPSELEDHDFPELRLKPELLRVAMKSKMAVLDMRSTTAPNNGYSPLDRPALGGAKTNIGMAHAAPSVSPLPPGAVISPRPSSSGKIILPPLGDGTIPETVVPVDPSNELTFLRTSEDAIEFFGQQGQSSEIKVIFLARPHEAQEYRPYDLRVVKRTDIDPEYFTMSATGLVHIKPGFPSQFVSLGQWWRASTIFNVLRSIHYFKHYLMCKSFRTWFSNVRFKKYCQQRTKLTRRLFLAKKSFCSTLIELNRQCYDLRCRRFTQINPKTTYNLDDFGELQNQTRLLSYRSFETTIDKMQALLEKVCEDVNARVRPSNEGEGHDMLGYSTRNRVGEKSKSMQAVKQEQLARQRALAEAQQEAEMLPQFIRLADNMVVENLMLVVLSAIGEFLYLLQKLGKQSKKSGLFSCVVTFGTSAMDFSPDISDFLTVMRTMTDAMITSVHSVPRLLYAPSFKSYFEGQVLAGPHLTEMLRNNENFNRICTGINTVLTTDFDSAVAESKVFEEYRDIYNYGEKFDPEEFVRREEEEQRQNSTNFLGIVKDLKKEMMKLRKWSDQLEKMKLTIVPGILQVEAKPLRISLQGCVNRCLDTLKEVLQRLARKFCVDILREYNERIKKLQMQPRLLKEFAQYVETKQAMEANAGHLESYAGQVDDMYKVLSFFEVKIPHNEQVKLDDLHNIHGAFAEVMANANAEINAKMPSQTQQLTTNINKMNDDFQDLIRLINSNECVDPSQDPADVISHITQTLKVDLDVLCDKAETFQSYQKLFAMEEADFSLVETAQNAYNMRHNLWSKLGSFEDNVVSWTQSEFLSLNVEDIGTEVQMHYKEAFKIFKIMENDEVARRYKESVERFRERMPVLTDLGQPSLKARHWEKIFHIMGKQYIPGFSLQTLLKYDVMDHRDAINEIAGVASGENVLELTLEKVQSAWANCEFVTAPYRESRDVFILSSVEDILTQLEDNQATLQTMIASRYITGIRDMVEVWDKKLSLLAETLDEWIQCQKQWMYLEPIFGQGDIQKQLPEETVKFQRVDQSWKDIMRKTHHHPNVLEAATAPNVLEMFQDSNKYLEEIQKSLEEYLETKRSSFPRFYFLSNDELLEILSQARDPRAVQPHLRKCFDSIASLDFQTNADEMEEIGSMLSAEGETVLFSEKIIVTGNVEFWLLEIERMMRKSLYDQMFAGLGAYSEETRTAWFFEYPAQMVLTVNQIVWTNNVTKALDSISDGTNANALRDFYHFSSQQLDNMVELVRGELSALDRECMGSLIVIDVHARDTIQQLIAAECSSVYDFDWIRQLRYYWDKDINNCTVLQTNAHFVYGFEYLGNCPRLVITPLTDKCYMTLTGAMHLKLGGAPAGPAGTGKTETTKDLGKALARQVVVFNCSDGLDFKMMGRFFSGLSQAGAWACFDEFNRIDIEVLSVVAQQVLCINQALLQNAERFVFEGREIPLSQNYGCFITMNPGYAGRTELPDNLKAMFRPVAMMVPDYALIAEIMLFSQGFTAARDLARKLTQLYRLSSEQLSSQDHYDFGMRAVKSVLVMAGTLKRAQPDVPEDITLIRALRDSNVPKFLADDVPLFMAIIRDLFPGVEIPPSDYGNLLRAIHEACVAQQRQIVESFNGKVIQLYETMQVRHGVMMVGTTMTGKTSCVEILAAAQTSLHGEEIAGYETVHTYKLNPKSITMGELYGEINLISNEWTDGLIADIVRQAVKAGDSSKKWVVFDGPVDALWIENMNTVLDDNKTLCLANAERIKLPSTVAMMFEVNDLAVASPATVSRCGMVYLEPMYLGWRPLAKSWLQYTMEPRLGKTMANRIFDSLEKTVDGTLEFLRKECKENVPSVDQNLVNSYLNLMASLMTEENGCTPDNDLTSELVPLYQAFSFVWSMGANLVESCMPKFDQFVRGTFIELFSKMPRDGTVYDYVVDRDTLTFHDWKTRVKPFNYSATVPYFSLLVPTVETTRIGFLLRVLVLKGHNVLVCGNSGVGKTVVVQDFLNESGDEELKFVGAASNFSAQTSSTNLQAFLDDKLEKLRKTLLGPPPGKQMVFFIDDLNMPQKEQYGAQPPLELLRQSIDQKGFYDRKKLFFKNIKDTRFITACGPPGGGRNEVTPRLIRHFSMFNFGDLAVASMQQIFVSISSGYFSIFAAEIAECAPKMVEASIEVYLRMREEMLPTPSRSHYTFNLRDLSKVVQGMLQVEKKFLDSPENFVRLWTHEASRVFQDRLINVDDKKWYTELITEMISKHFALTWESTEFATVLWGDWASPGDRAYKILPEEKLERLLIDYQEDYVVSVNKPSGLVFFRDAIEHVSRICRVLRQPRGNALLVGVGGSGRQSLTRLSAHIMDYKCFQIELSRGYGMNEFHEDLKKLLMMTGAQNKQMVFLFSDTQIINESFLEDINNVLNAGEVPDLFARDEMEKIINDVRPLCKAAGKIDTRDNIYQHFVALVRENLHIVLAMSPVGDSFRSRIRRFPSLVNCCTIDWFTEWPEDALLSVANSFLKTVEMDDRVKEVMVKMCQYIHSTVGTYSERFFVELRRRNYTTPTSYLELINMYTTMLKEQRAKNFNATARFKGGLEKLAETNETVEKLKVDLVALQPTLVKAAEATAKLLVEVAADQKEAEVMKATVQTEEKEVTRSADEAKRIKDDAQADLDQALPAFEVAVQALKGLSKSDLTELKSFTNPPPLVMTVMEAVCILLGVKASWDESKKLLGDTGMLVRLEKYDKDNVSDSTMHKLKKYIANPDFQPQVVEKKSLACKSLCLWVRAIDMYAKVARTVEPKRAALAAAEESLAKMQQMLAEKQAVLAKVIARVEDLEAKYKNSLDERDSLQKQSETTKARLERAGLLISGLESEQVRWDIAMKQLESDRVNLEGDMMLAAGCVAYLGPFTASYRQELLDAWNKLCVESGVPCDTSFSLERCLGDPVQIRDWNIQGLPADKLSLENGIIVTRGRRWPLMTDPQQQANRWIRSMERSNNLQIFTLTEPNYLRTLENCIRMGNPALLENIEEVLDPALEPVLLKQVYKTGGRMLIRLGDQEVDYNPDFKFYITTKLANPHYPPEVSIKVTLVNFTVTPKGLEDQLLAHVVAHERPELEEQKATLVEKISQGQKQLQDIQDKILSMLAASDGNILDDEVLIATLNASKTTSADINSQVMEAQETAVQIDAAREGYRTVATRASILYFIVADLANIDPMYQFSLVYFTKLFNLVIEKATKSDVLDERLNILINAITEATYDNVCRALFEKDKQMFAFLMAVQILRGYDKISLQEWMFFLTNGGMLDAAKFPPNPSPQWLTDTTWCAVNVLSDFPSFDGLADSFRNQNKTWKDLFDHDTPHRAPLPTPYEFKLTGFRRLMMIRVLRDVKVCEAVVDFVKAELGPRFIEPPPFDLKKAYDDSSASTPIIFVLSPGADPTSYLLTLAEELGFGGDRLKMISLGQGQGPIAEQLINAAKDDGTWVCLQNCHLAASWMPQLEKLLQSFENKQLNESYRLWLTSMPSPKFPVSVLQNGIKITNEPPKGLRANLARTYIDLTEQRFDACTKPEAWKRLLFGVAFFHAVILERRKFGAVGWNIPYEWNNSDILVSIQHLKMYLEDQNDVPYQTLNYVIGDCNYGGRITDVWDQRCARCVLSKYLCAEVMDLSYAYTEDGVYRPPPEGSLQDHRDFIAALPLNDVPDIFGLHQNAQITFEAKETKYLLDTILSLQPKTAAAVGAKSPDEVVGELGADILSQLPNLLTREDCHPMVFLEQEGAVNSLGTFLSIEMEKFNRLLKVVRSSLLEMAKALKGLVVMSAELDVMYSCFITMKVPPKWAGVAYPSIKPLGSWVQDMFARVKFMQKWLDEGPPSAYWVSGFFFPQGFLTACAQMHARKHRIPIDTLTFRTEVQSFDVEQATPPLSGVLVYGLFMEGARWDRSANSIQESLPGTLFCKMPCILLEPIETDRHHPTGVYDCPLYKTSTRAGTLSTTGHSTNFVRLLELPTEHPSEHWVRRGTALLCQLDD